MTAPNDLKKAGLWLAVLLPVAGSVLGAALYCADIKSDVRSEQVVNNAQNQVILDVRQDVAGVKLDVAGVKQEQQQVGKTVAGMDAKLDFLVKGMERLENREARGRGQP